MNTERKPIEALDQERKMVAALEQQLAEAHRTLNLEAIENLLHPDYLIVQPGGTIENRSEIISSLKSGTRHWDVAESDQLDVRVYGTTAVALGRWHAVGQNAGQSFDYTARFLSIWIKDKGSWRNIAYQSTEIAKQ